MLGEPGLREPPLRAGQPRLRDEVEELLAVDAGEVADADEHGRVAVEVLRREVDAARVGEDQLLHVEVGDAEHQHVVEPLPRRRVEGVRPAAALQAEAPAVDEIRRPPVLGHLLRHLRQRERELVEVGHRGHARSLTQSSRRGRARKNIGRDVSLPM